MILRILANYDGRSDECIQAAYNTFRNQLTDLVIHAAVPPVPYCSALETCFFDPSYAEEIDQEYYSKKQLCKQKEYAQKYPNVSIEPILSKVSPGLSLLSTCIAKNPDLVIICRGNSSHNIFGVGDEWGIVRKRCHKPILEIKKGE